MYFLGFQIFIFFSMDEILASRYYYAEKSGIYDVYQGPRAIWGYKEVKSPKSYKINFEDRKDRPGRCIPGNFFCKEPYQAKETEIFQCEVDYQCPSYFKCCQVTCFQHKICQPASTEEDKVNEISTINPTAESKSSEVTATSIGQHITTLEIGDPATRRPSDLRSTTESTTTSLKTNITNLETENIVTYITKKTTRPPFTSSTSSNYTKPPTTISLNPQVTTLQTETSYSYTTDKTSEIYNTYSSTLETSQATVKPHTIYTKSDKTTIQIKEKPEYTSTLSTNTDSTTRLNLTENMNEDLILKTTLNKGITTDDQDISFSGDNELNTSTLGRTVDSSTTSLFTPVFITIKERMETTKASTTIPPKSSINEDKLTTEFLEISTIQTSAETYFTTTNTSKSQTESNVTLETALLNTAQFAETTNKSPLPITKFTSQKEAKFNTDDEDIAFSGDYEITGSYTPNVEDVENISYKSLETIIKSDAPPISDPTKIFSILATSSTESFIPTDIVAETSSADKNDPIESTQMSSLDSSSSHKISEYTTIFSHLATSSTEPLTSTIESVETSDTDENNPNNTIKSTQTTGSRTTTHSSILHDIVSSESTTDSNINKNITSYYDEDLSFSGDGDLDTSTSDEVSMKTARDNLLISSVKPITPTEKNMKNVIRDVYIDSDDEDVTFSGDDQIKVTTDELTMMSSQKANTKHSTTESSTNVPASLKLITTEKNIHGDTLEIDVDKENATLSTETSRMFTTFKPSSFLTKSTVTLKPKQPVESSSNESTKLESEHSEENSLYNISDQPSSSSSLITNFTSTPLSEKDQENVSAIMITRDTAEITSNNKDISTNGSYTIPKSTISAFTNINSNTDSSLLISQKASTAITNNTKKYTVAESTTINTNNNAENITYGTGISFANSFVQLLRNVPRIVIMESSDSADPYFKSFLAFIGRVTNFIKSAEDNTDFFINSASKYETIVPDVTENL